MAKYINSLVKRQTTGDLEHGAGRLIPSETDWLDARLPILMLTDANVRSSDDCSTIVVLLQVDRQQRTASEKGVKKGSGKAPG